MLLNSRLPFKLNPIKIELLCFSRFMTFMEAAGTNLVFKELKIKEEERKTLIVFLYDGKKSVLPKMK